MRTYQLPVRRSAHHLWQGLPWNALFWVATCTIASVATVLTIQVEIRRLRSLAVDEAAEVLDGDRVDVVVVLNGDELIVAKDGARARIRIVGIRSFDPVVNEFEITTFGRAAVGMLENWVVGHEVKLNIGTPAKDIHGRALAYVERDGVDVGRHMVEEGVSMVYTEYPFEREAAYLSAEQLARSARRGLWGGAKAHARARGLRRDWSAACKRHTGAIPADPLLGGE